jgi:hypothetical protein
LSKETKNKEKTWCDSLKSILWNHLHFRDAWKRPGGGRQGGWKFDRTVALAITLLLWLPGPGTWYKALGLWSGFVKAGLRHSHHSEPGSEFRNWSARAVDRWRNTSTSGTM